MKILIYGAGVIGSIIAGKLVQGGYDVTVLARGGRLKEINDKGIILNNIINFKMDFINIKAKSEIEDKDVFDYIFVTVRNNQVDEVLPVLARNKSPNIVFMVNNPLGYDKWVSAVGHDRVIIGFPAAGGECKSGVINYHIGGGITKIFQSTTFGELNGKNSKRLGVLCDVFKGCGFSPAVHNKMDWWQKTHVAVILPIAKALYGYQSNNYELSKSFLTLKNMVYATRELFSVLKSNDIDITPAKLLFYYLPSGIIARIWQSEMESNVAEYALAKHVLASKEEIELLEKQFMTLNVNSIDLPYYNAL
jgi:2-dehydropantoate 2-reductase